MQIEIRAPDDMHLHLRQERMLEAVIGDTTRVFRRAIVMPNLIPPVTTTEKAIKYYHAIKTACLPTTRFEPLMTLYLTEAIDADEIDRAKASQKVKGIKLYPLNATTNAAHGIRDIANCYPIFERMEKLQMPLLVHAESHEASISILDKEKVFIDTILQPITQNFPKLSIVVEHVSTKDGVDFVLSSSENVVATITPHHLCLTIDDIFRNGINPHNYCLPIVKHSSDQKALRQAATSNNPKFFLGTDSAPHTITTKECCCGNAGIYNAFNAIEWYTAVFEQENALSYLENFASCFGAQFYKLPYNQERILLEKRDWTTPEHISRGQENLVPFQANKVCGWKIVRHLTP